MDNYDIEEPAFFLFLPAVKKATVAHFQSLIMTVFKMFQYRNPVLIYNQQTKQ